MRSNKHDFLIDTRPSSDPKSKFFFGILEVSFIMPSINLKYLANEIMKRISINILFFTVVTLIVVSCGTENSPPATFTLTTSVSPAEGGSVSPTQGSFEEDETVSLQARPTEGWVFSRWEQDLNTTANPMNITMNQDYNVVGVFEQRMHALTVDVEGQGTVTETVVQQKATDYAEGTIVELEAVPEESWVFVNWEGDLSGSDNPAQITVDEPKSVVGVFEQRMHALTIDIEGEGTVTETVVQQKATDYAEGTVVELEAIPAESWVFRHWKGDLSGSDNPVKITVDEPKSIVADFFTLPTVGTGSVRSITENSAQSGGDVTDDGGSFVTTRGICWSTSQNPTTNDSCTSDGSGTGTFSSTLTNLSSFTEYFVRAYATNSAGTAYGNQRNFTTDSEWQRDATTEVVDVTNPVTGKTWMDRNLGAFWAGPTSTDPHSYGDLYQWGRAADGHEKRSSGTTFKLSSTDTPGHEAFIISPEDWRSPQNDNLWQGVNGTNNPCPFGYRLPTEAEWEAEFQSWSSSNAAGAFSSPLKLPMAGYREHSDGGSPSSEGYYGGYWSSTVDGAYPRILSFRSSPAGIASDARASGHSVRCIKD